MMKKEYEEEGPTKQELKSLKSLKKIFPCNFKQAVSELNPIKGVRRKELINFITTVYNLEDEKVARAVAIECKRLTHRRQIDSKRICKRRVTNSRRSTRPRVHTKKYCLGPKAKQKALERIEQLCGICGGSKKKRKDCKEEKKKDDKSKQKKKEDDKCKPKKKEDQKSKGKKKGKSKKPRKPAGVTCSRKLDKKGAKRARYDPTEKNSVNDDSDEDVGSNNKHGTEKKDGGTNEGGQNHQSNPNPESEHQRQLYIS